jgi:hypothetical protein
MIVNINNCHETIINFVEENETQITSYEDIKNVYADMISKHYYFIIDRDLISDILVDITYALSATAINRGRVIGTIDMEEEDGNFSD